MKKIEKENKETEKSTEFANTIYRIRRERKLTQKEMGEIIGVSDRTISKWETGSTVPDLCQINNICKKLEITPSFLVKSERKFKDNLMIIKRKLGKALNYILHNIFLIGFIIIFILLLAYFVNNFNSIKIYDLKYESENISFENGSFFKTKVSTIVIINDIKINKIKYKPTQIKIQLYTYVNGDKKVLYESDNLDNIYIEENKSNTDLLSKDTIDNMKRNLQMTIATKDENNNEYTYECQITFKEKFNNNKLSYKTYVKENKNYETSSESTDNLSLFNENKPNLGSSESTTASTNPNKLWFLGYEYNKEKDTYTKIDGDIKIEYSPGIYLLYVSDESNEGLKNIRYYYNLNKIDFVYTANNKVKTIFDYNPSTKQLKCTKGNCKNYKKEIDKVLSIYKEIKRFS